MAVTVRYKTRTMVDLPKAYVNVQDVRLEKITGTRPNGERFKAWSLNGVANIFASKEAAENPAAPPMESVVFQGVTDLSVPMLEAAYGVLRQHVEYPTLSPEQFAELQEIAPSAKDIGEDETRDQAAQRIRSGLVRKWFGDKADGWRPFAEARDA